MKKQQIESEIQRTLDALDHVQRVEPSPFLATRVLARWERVQEATLQPQGMRQWQWALVIALLLINGFALLPKWINFNAREDYLNSVAADYSIDTNTGDTYNYLQMN